MEEAEDEDPYSGYNPTIRSDTFIDYSAMPISKCVEGVFTILQRNQIFTIEKIFSSAPPFNSTGTSKTSVTPVNNFFRPYGDFQTTTTFSSSIDVTRTDIVYITLYLLVMFFAVVGNTLVIITISSTKRMRNVTNIFLLSMAVSDLLIAVVCIPINLTGKVLTRFIFGPVVCSLFSYVIGVSVMVSTYTMLAISIERYYAICSPLDSRRWQTNSHSIKMIFVIWFASLIVMLPYVIGSRLIDIPIYKLRQCVLACRMIIKSQALSKVWYGFLLVEMFFIPGILMAIAYTKICFKIYERFEFDSNIEDKKNSDKAGIEDNKQCDRLIVPSQYDSTKLTTSKSNLKKEKVLRTSKNSEVQEAAKKKVTIMLLIIVILYFLCWTPLYVVNMWKAIDRKDAFKRFDEWIRIIKMMSYLSTCVNPIVYCFANRSFRQGFIKSFLSCLPTCCADKLRMRRHGRTNMLSDNTQNVTIMSSTRTRNLSTSRA